MDVDVDVDVDANYASNAAATASAIARVPQPLARHAGSYAEQPSPQAMRCSPRDSTSGKNTRSTSSTAATPLCTVRNADTRGSPATPKS